MQVHLECRECRTGEADGSAVLALARIAGGDASEVIVFCRRPEHELCEIRAFVESAIGLGADPGDLAIVTSHPNAAWLRNLSERGLGRVGLEIRSHPDGDLVGRWTIDGALEAICPELHSKAGADVELSVCGAHKDHMVVSPTQTGRWCLADHRYCPHKLRRDTDRS